MHPGEDQGSSGNHIEGNLGHSTKLGPRCAGQGTVVPFTEFGVLQHIPLSLLLPKGSTAGDPAVGPSLSQGKSQISAQNTEPRG